MCWGENLVQPGSQGSRDTLGKIWRVSTFSWVNRCGREECSWRKGFYLPEPESGKRRRSPGV